MQILSFYRVRLRAGRIDSLIVSTTLNALDFDSTDFPMPTGLYADDESQALEERATALACLATAMERALAKMYLGERKYTDEDAQFGCHPYRLADFLTLLFQAQRALELIHGAEGAKAAKFLDVGCGVGTKVYLAGVIHWGAHGIENDATVAEFASQFVADIPSCRIMATEALTFADYGDYDVIFFYRPLRDEWLQEQLEATIYAQAREGCVLLPMYPICEPPSSSFVAVIPTQLYVKTYDAELSRRLMAEFAAG